MDSEPLFSIVMPCLNEAETLEACITKARASLLEHGLPSEIIVADNGSTDGSPEIAQRLGARLVRAETKGYGSAVMAGIAAARGTYVIMGDSDDSYDFARLGPFIRKLQEGYELVMGTRFKGGIEKGAMPLLHRYIGNPLVTTIGRIRFRSSCSDFHCGLRGFNRASVMRLDLRTTGMEFASEMVVKATLYGLRIVEVPTILSPDGRSRPSHVRTWHDGWRHLRFLLLYSPRWLFLYPGGLLMLLGLLGVAALLRGPMVVGDTAVGVQTLLYSAVAIIIGFQAITFAVFTKVFAVLEGLLPPDLRLNTLFRYVRLESGLAVGAVLLLVGVGGAAYAFAEWRMSHFGALDPTRAARVIVPSVTSLILGFQIVLASFFLSVLGLKRRG